MIGSEVYISCKGERDNAYRLSNDTRVVNKLTCFLLIVIVCVTTVTLDRVSVIVVLRFTLREMYKAVYPSCTKNKSVTYINLKNQHLWKKYNYSLFQNGRHYSVLLFSFKLPLVDSFLNLKVKRIFSLKRGNRGN